jgi:hypothetical protein
MEEPIANQPDTKNGNGLVLAAERKENLTGSKLLQLRRSKRKTIINRASAKK